MKAVRTVKRSAGKAKGWFQEKEKKHTQHKQGIRHKIRCERKQRGIFWWKENGCPETVESRPVYQNLGDAEETSRQPAGPSIKSKRLGVGR